MDRRTIEALLEKGRTGEAIALLRTWLEQEPSSSRARAGLSILESVSTEHPRHFVDVRLGLLSTFTIEPLAAHLRLWGFLNRLRIDVHCAPFSQIESQLLDGGSELWRFDPEVIAIACDGADLAAPLYERYLHLAASDGVEPLVVEALARTRGWMEAVRERSSAPVLIHGFVPPIHPSLGCMDTSVRPGQIDTVHRMNRELADQAREVGSVYVIDAAGLASEIGSQNWSDVRLLHLASMRLSQLALSCVANAYLAFLRPLTGLQRKCLVLDLDDTLWGGTVGEVGSSGVLLSTEAPGSAYRCLQQAVLELHDRGVLLALNSKNNPEDALEVIERHPEMILRSGHFAAMRINWQDKASNLREIAGELNIGLDQIVFVDDNPAERAWVRTQLPEVLVPELPEDPAGYASALRSIRDFDTLTWSPEDRSRTRMIRQEVRRRDLLSASPSLEEFYESLEMRASVLPGTSVLADRIAQLTQRTNQFNLTTRRRSSAAIRELLSDEQRRVYALSLEDRFGANGVVGAAILRCEAVTWTIEDFLLSCRVLGRTVEQAFLAFLAEQARHSGARLLRGLYSSTPKNRLAATFYEKQGFERETSDEAEEERWILGLEGGGPRVPRWIDLQVQAPASLEAG